MKVHETRKLNEIIAVIEVDDVSLGKDSCSSTRTFPRNPLSCYLGWSDDGQLMGIISSRSILHVFISRLPLMSGVSSTGIVARFTSLLEITLEPLCVSFLSDF